MRASGGDHRAPKVAPGRDSMRGHGLGKDHPAAEDGDGTRTRRARKAHRLHPAPPPRRGHSSGTRRGGARMRGRRDSRIPAQVREKTLRLHPRQVHDRRSPSRRNARRSAPPRLRRDHRRRSARAHAQRRLPPRHPQAHPRETPRPEGDRLLRNARLRALLRLLRRRAGDIGPGKALSRSATSRAT